MLVSAGKKLETELRIRAIKKVQILQYNHVGLAFQALHEAELKLKDTQYKK